jgi:hypothetical protein
MNTAILPPEAERFLKQLKLGLASLSHEERADLVAELRSHLLERHTQGKRPLLEGFEDPEVYASRFVTEAALRGALARGTSVALGQALLTGARRSLWLVCCVAPLLAIQLIGALLVGIGLLKPFMPERVGLFLRPDGDLVAMGAYGGNIDGLREVLGYWAMPAFIVGGVLLLWSGNQILRSLAQWRLGNAGTRE